MFKKKDPTNNAKYNTEAIVDEETAKIFINDFYKKFHYLTDDIETTIADVTPSLIIAVKNGWIEFVDEDRSIILKIISPFNLLNGSLLEKVEFTAMTLGDIANAQERLAQGGTEMSSTKELISKLIPNAKLSDIDRMGLKDIEISAEILIRVMVLHEKHYGKKKN